MFPKDIGFRSVMAGLAHEPSVKYQIGIMEMFEIREVLQDYLSFELRKSEACGSNPESQQINWNEHRKTCESCAAVHRILRCFRILDNAPEV